ncbi:MAG: hypothetical protein ABSA94_13570 [Acidobacteriaceae bacterium]|jgi:hypothetical protein
MQPNRLGRALGIGARVAAEKLRDGTAGAAAAVQRSAATQPAPAAITHPKPTEPAIPSAPSIAEGSRRLARGAGRFGATLWRPFAHATGILTLQITGSFFAIFTLVFAVHSWQLYKSAGWHDHHLPLYAAFAALFAWFTVSSFWRASRKQKRA